MAGTVTPASPGASGPGSSLIRARTRRTVGESVVRTLLFLAAAVSVLTTTLIVLSLLRETINFFSDVSISDYLFGTKWTPLLSGEQQSFNVWPLLFATFYITAIALVVALPLGLLCAVYLAEYASRRVRKVVKPVLELLAGVPTIVFGYFALAFFTPEILKPLIGSSVGTNNQLAAGIIVGLLVLPTIASVAEDSMSAVPQSLREGAFGIGANRMQVSLRVIFPAALSGVVAAVVLGASRAFGETVVILLAAGNGQLLPKGAVTNPLDPAGNMAAFIAGTAGGDIGQGSIEYKTIFAIGLTLFVVTLILNALAIRLDNKYLQVYE